MKLHSLLAIDWDFMFPVVEASNPNADLALVPLYDWAHNDSLMREIGKELWSSRAAAFKKRELPLPLTSGEEEEFWERFRISKNAQLYYADDNAFAVKLPNAHNTEAVWLYDAHHDCGYKETPQASIESVTVNQRVTCEDWMIFYGNAGAKLHVRYPRWRAYAIDTEPEPALFGGDRTIADLDEPDCLFDRVFVCRSGTWVPPWLDHEFDAFLKKAPVKERRRIGPLPRRSFRIDQVDERALGSLIVCGTGE